MKFTGRAVLRATSMWSFALLASALFLLSPHSRWVGDAAAQGYSPDLEGSWRALITIRDCETDVAVPFAGNPFLALVSIAQGGTMTAIDAYPGLGPAQLSPALGTWQDTKRGTFSAVTEAFVFTPTGSWLGTKRLTQIIAIGKDDPDTFTARAQSVFFAPNGGPIPGFPPSTICATSIAQRME